MPEKLTAEALLNNLVETLADSIPAQKSVSFFEENRSSSVTTQFSRLFGRQQPVHHVLGGGKSADVLLWRNKKISAGVLSSATAIWILFEWLNYHFLSLVCLGLIVLLLAQFVWSNASGFTKRSNKKVPRLVLQEECFVNIAKAIGSEVNRTLAFFQDVACGGNLKQIFAIVAGLWVAAVIGSWCNFLTVCYIGFVGAHTLPVLYERHEDQVDSFVYNVLENLQNHYRRVEAGVLSKVSKGKKDE